MSEIPRRCRLDLSTPAELAIRAAVDAVEALPADVGLTNAVILLGHAREAVADYVDGIHVAVWPCGATAKGSGPLPSACPVHGAHCFGDVAVPARAHQEEKEHEMPDEDSARSGTREIRDRQPAAVTDAGATDDCAGTEHRCVGCQYPIGSPGLCGECSCEDDGAIW